MSFLNILLVFCDCDETHFSGKQLSWNFSKPHRMPSASPSMLLYQVSVLDSFLLVNARSHCLVLYVLSSSYLLPMCLFLGVEVLFYCRISCIYLL